MSLHQKIRGSSSNIWEHEKHGTNCSLVVLEAEVAVEMMILSALHLDH